jgi:hypothetical protein
MGTNQMEILSSKEKTCMVSQFVSEYETAGLVLV